MSEIIAKKYVKALLGSLKDKEIKDALNNLQSLIPAYDNKKFNSILNSYDISDDDKANFILSLFKKPDAKLINFIKLLSANKRLTDIPSIVKELSNQISVKENKYEGFLISGFKVKADEIKDIEQNISKKLNTSIKLKNRVTDYSGIKVEVDSLGIEVSFSADRLKAQMSEHILKSL